MQYNIGNEYTLMKSIPLLCLLICIVIPMSCTLKSNPTKNAQAKFSKTNDYKYILELIGKNGLSEINVLSSKDLLFEKQELIDSESRNVYLLFNCQTAMANAEAKFRISGISDIWIDDVNKCLKGSNRPNLPTVGVVCLDYTIFLADSNASGSQFKCVLLKFNGETYLYVYANVTEALIEMQK
jgi:hypothetical protein